MSKLVKYWNPAPIITHMVDESANGAVTLCGVPIVAGWESGDDANPYEVEQDYACSCAKCRRIAKVRMSKQEPQP